MVTYYLYDTLTACIYDTVLEISIDNRIDIDNNDTILLCQGDFVELHVIEKSNEKTTKETLRWVHITISNAKKKSFRELS